MIAGIVINSANDLMFSQNGTIAALAAVLVTSVYTVVSFASYSLSLYTLVGSRKTGRTQLDTNANSLLPSPNELCPSSTYSAC